MDIVTKIIAGGPGRRTRFHTEPNELIPMSGFAALPTVMAQWLRTRLTGTRPEAPWWPLAVIPVIERHLSKDSNVIEFGSGSSTIWLAKRARCVVSFEDDENWHRKTLHRLKQAGLQNSEVLFRVDEGYYRLEGVDPDQQFDLAVVDGSWRWLCLEHVLPRMKPGGIVYLDNADADKDLRSYPEPSHRRLAQRKLETYLAAIIHDGDRI